MKHLLGLPCPCYEDSCFFCGAVPCRALQRRVPCRAAQLATIFDMLNTRPFLLFLPSTLHFFSSNYFFASALVPTSAFSPACTSTWTTGA